MSGAVELGKHLANFLGNIINPNKVETKSNSTNNVPVGQTEKTNNVTNIDDLLAQDTKAIYGTTLSLGNTQATKLSPVEHPEIKALSERLSEYVGIPHISSEIAAEINRTADLRFATNELVKRNNVSLEKDIAEFTPEERVEVTRAFQTAQVMEAMRRITEEIPDNVQARIEQDFMKNFT